MVPRTLDTITLRFANSTFFPECSSDFWIDCLRIVEEVPHSIEEKGLIEFETNFLKLLDVKEVFKVYRGLIVSMDGSHLYDWNNLYGWNNLNNR